MIRLPNGYTRVRYIQSTGDQYILTGIIPNKDTVASITFSTNQQSSCGVLACDLNWKNRGFGIWGNAVALGNVSTEYVLNDGQVHTVLISGAKVHVDNTLVMSYTGAYFEAPVDLSVFALNRNGVVQEKSAVTMYNLTIDQDSFVPCVSPSGEVGVYSTGQNRFISNMGAGKFIAGPEIPSVTSAYPVGLKQVSSTYNSISVSWSSYSGATEYRVYCNGVLAGSTSATSFMLTGLDADRAYGVQVSAVTANGETLKSPTILAFTELQNFKLITDRTEQDVLYAANQLRKDVDSLPQQERDEFYQGLRGSYNAMDFRRVSYAVKLLADILVHAGVKPDYKLRFDWKPGEIQRENVQKEYLRNVQLLRDSIDAPMQLPDLPPDMVKFTYAEANNIELVIHGCVDGIADMLKDMVPCGTALCGGDYL